MHQHFIQPLFAAADFVHIAIMLGVLLLGVLKQLFDASNKSAKKNAKLAVATPPPQKIQPLSPKPPALAGQQADGLRSQVEEFLRRAGQQPGSQQPQTAQQRPTSEIELLVPVPTRTLVEQRSPTTKSQPAPPNRQRNVRRLKRQSVAEHVAETVTASTQTLAEKADQLGQRIVNEDQQFDRELKAKFDHTLGTLTESGTTQTSAGPPATDTPAAQIAALLANPSGVRQAVVINEILQRPSYRW